MHKFLLFVFKIMSIDEFSNKSYSLTNLRFFLFFNDIIKDLLNLFNVVYKVFHLVLIYFFSDLIECSYLICSFFCNIINDILNFIFTNFRIFLYNKLILCNFNTVVCCSRFCILLYRTIFQFFYIHSLKMNEWLFEEINLCCYRRELFDNCFIYTL